MEEMETDSELLENIIACRTCGIHYVTPNKYQLKHLFQSPLEHSEIMLIRLELAQWNVEVAENDGFPQHVCNTCIHKFEQVFELRAACINAQNEFRKFYNVPNGNFANIKIKTERKDQDEEEQPICDFIYVDDLSDTEYDGATPFNIPHVPIKEEVIEAATIPMEESQQPNNIVESAAEVVVQSDTSASHIPQLITQNDSVAADPTSSAVFEEMPVQEVECKLCHHVSSSQDDHKQHMQRAHEIRDMECHICGKEFKNSTPARLKFHMKWHTLNKHVKCTLCGFICSSKDALREHKRANHSKINCKICGKGVLAKKMKSHLRRHELLNKFKCEYCTEAFPSEQERENHIWQIHANEDNTATNISIPAMQVMAHTSQELNEDMLREHQTTEEVMYAQSHDDDLLNYKFLCAHCDQRFMEQIDLETHVNEEHRAQTQLATAEECDESTTEINENTHINQTGEIMQHDEDVENDNEHTNITVFEDYDNDTEIPLPTNETNSLTQTEHVENEEDETHEHSEEAEHYQTETASNTSDDEQEDETDDAQSEIENNINVTSAFVEGNLNTFACAKCSETFVTIEQLRQHYEQHLAANQPDEQQKKLTPTKSQFKCNLCGKCFDLKFSLNRHVKKHKHAPI